VGPDPRDRCTPTDPYIRTGSSNDGSTNNPVPAGANHHHPTHTLDLAAMDSYSPGTSFYPCPLRAADIFKPQAALPPIYYLKDHVRVEYNDSDWPTTPEDEEEAHKEEMNDPARINAAGDASMMVRVLAPLGLLSLKMREHHEKEKSASNASEGEGISKEGRIASSGRPSVPFPHISPTLVAERLSKADIPQGPLSGLKYNKVHSESNVNPRARKPLAASANARKK